MNDRSADAAARFLARFGQPPTLRVDVPGRVNLIGEHIDYNGLAVLPMAIQLRITLHLRPRADTRFRIVTDLAGFDECVFEAAATIPPGAPGDWCNYLRAAAQDCVVHHGRLNGLDGLLASTIPVAAGLSSSSALIIAAALGLLHANATELAAVTLAQRMAAAERYVGTQGGGMDQAIILGALAGHAARIDFQPLRLQHTPVPASWRFVVADSGVPAEKSRVMREAYNTRGRESAAALARVAELFPGSEATYRALLAAHGENALIQAGHAVLDGVLLRRFRHVVLEAGRVDKAVSALRDGDAGRFGDLMTASHESLRADYEVSSPALDELVDAALAAGAAGARLTGAGFGGCIVALTSVNSCDDLMHALRRHTPRPSPAGVEQQRLVLAAEPSAGAQVTRL